MSEQVGPVTARLLGLRDAKLRRCGWCGDWCWHVDPCQTCGTKAPPVAAIKGRRVA